MDPLTIMLLGQGIGLGGQAFSSIMNYINGNKDRKVEADQLARYYYNQNKMMDEKTRMAKKLSGLGFVNNRINQSADSMMNVDDMTNRAKAMARV